MRESVVALRSLLDGERIDVSGDHVRARGFKLRRPQTEASITVAAFGPHMTRVGARFADELVLNLVTPEHVAAVRERIDAEAAAARPVGAAAGSVGSGRARSRRASAGTAGGTARGVSRRPRVRRAVRRARLRGSRRPRPSRRGARASSPMRSRASSSSRSGPSATPSRSPRGWPPITTPAPITSPSSRARRRIPPACGCLDAVMQLDPAARR